MTSTQTEPHGDTPRTNSSQGSPIEQGQAGKSLLFKVRGANQTLAAVVQKRLQSQPLESLLSGSFGDAIKSVVLESKASAKEPLVAVSRDVLHVSFPAKPREEEALIGRVIQRVVGFAIRDTVLGNSVYFMKHGAVPPHLEQRLKSLVQVFSSSEPSERLTSERALSKALVPYREQFSELKKKLEKEIKSPVKVTLENVGGETELFFERLVTFRAVSELCGNSRRDAALVPVLVVAYAAKVQECLAEALGHDDPSARERSLNALDTYVRNLATGGWFKSLPQSLESVSRLADVGLFTSGASFANLVVRSAEEVGTIDATPLPEAGAKVIKKLTARVADLRAAMPSHESVKPESFDQERFEQELADLAFQMPAVLDNLSKKFTSADATILRSFLEAVYRLRFATDPELREDYKVLFAPLGTLIAGSQSGQIAGVVTLEVLRCLGTLQRLSSRELTLEDAAGQLLLDRDFLIALTRQWLSLVFSTYAESLSRCDPASECDLAGWCKVAKRNLQALEKSAKELGGLGVDPSGLLGVTECVPSLIEMVHIIQALFTSDRESVRVLLSQPPEIRFQASDNEAKKIVTICYNRIRDLLRLIAPKATENLEELANKEEVNALVDYVQRLMCAVRYHPESDESTYLRNEASRELIRCLTEFDCAFSALLSEVENSKAPLENLLELLAVMSQTVEDVRQALETLKPFRDLLDPLVLSKAELLISETAKKVALKLRRDTDLLSKVVTELVGAERRAQQSRFPDPSALEKLELQIRGMALLRIPVSVIAQEQRHAYSKLTSRERTAG